MSLDEIDYEKIISKIVDRCKLKNIMIDIILYVSWEKWWF